MVLRGVARGESAEAAQQQTLGLQQLLLLGFSSKKDYELGLRADCESPKEVIHAALLMPHPSFQSHGHTSP